MAEKHQKKKKGSALKILLAVLLLLVLTAGAAGVFAYNEENCSTVILRCKPADIPTMA